MKILLLIIFSAFTHSAFCQAGKNEMQTVPATQPLPPVPPSPSAPDLALPTPPPEVPVQSLPATDPNDLNKSSTANPDLLQPPADTARAVSSPDSLKKPK